MAELSMLPDLIDRFKNAGLEDSLAVEMAQETWKQIQSELSFLVEKTGKQDSDLVTGLIKGMPWTEIANLENLRTYEQRKAFTLQRIRRSVNSQIGALVSASNLEREPQERVPNYTPPSRSRGIDLAKVTKTPRGQKKE